MTEYDLMRMSVPPPEGAICDFCSSPDVRWAFPCRDHAEKTEHATAVVLGADGSPTEVHKYAVDGFSRGGWAACPACHMLILRGERDRLARRSASRMMRNHPNLLFIFDDLVAHLRRLHDQFWANREGAPIPATRNPEDPTR